MLFCIINIIVGVMNVALRVAGPTTMLTAWRRQKSNRKGMEPLTMMKESQGLCLCNHPSQIKKLLQRRLSRKQMWN